LLVVKETSILIYFQVINNKTKNLVLSGKKKHANDFSLKRTCHWHLIGAISSYLAVIWQVGQLIDFLFSCIALYSAISSRLAVNWQVGQLIDFLFSYIALYSAISSCLAVNWQVGQLIDFLFSYIALYSAISSCLAVNWQVGQLISN